MSKIFISGAAGVIGKELVKILLKYKHSLFLGDLKPCPKEFINRVTYYQGDLNEINPNLISNFKPDYFVHLAASFERLEESIGHIDDNFINNTSLSLKLLKIFLNQNKFNIKKVIFASSYLIYHNAYSKSSLNTLDEKSTISPRNLTGISKLMHENEIKLIMSNHNIEYYILRIFRGYGKGSKDIISRWIKNSLNNKINYISNPNNSFDFIYSKDSATVISKILKNKNKNKSGIYNLGSGKSHTIKNISSMIKSILPNSKFRIISDRYENERSVSNINKLKENFRIKNRFNIEKNIKEIVNFQKNNKDNLDHFNILISCIGSKKNILDYVIESTKNFGQKIDVFISDSNKKNILFKIYNKKFYLPTLNNSNIFKIKKILIEKKINLVIPTGNEELLFWSKFKSLLKKFNIIVALPDYNKIIKFHDKYLFYQIHSRKFNVIPTFHNPNQVKSEKLVAKKRYGSGSKDLYLRITSSEAKNLFIKSNEYIFQEFIDGYELSVDAYISKQNKLIGFFVRKREVVENGESKYSTITLDKKIYYHIKKIIKNLDIYGPLVMQIIVDKQNNFNVIEVNTRVGGATGLSIIKGLKIYDYLIKEYLFKEKLNKNIFSSDQTKAILKFTKDYFL